MAPCRWVPLLVLILATAQLGVSFRPDHALVQAHAEALESKLEKAEKANIRSVSFVPTTSEFQALLKQSALAEKEREDGTRGPLLSKLYSLPGKFGLCPDSLRPDDTILAKLGRGSSRGGIGPGGSIGDASVLTFINDRNMPLGSSSNGPNAVLTGCSSGEYGTEEKPRMNLFYESEDKVKALLDDFMSLRKSNEVGLFKMYVAKLQEHSQGGKSEFKLDPSKEQLLAAEMQPHYVNAVSLLQKVASAIGDKGTLADYGLKVISYCQTWLRNGGGLGGQVGDAQFSVMSPHFQTRFFVTSAKKLDAAHVTAAEKESYLILIEHFDEVMAQSGYSGEEGPAFVNLDGLHFRLLNLG